MSKHLKEELRIEDTWIDLISSKNLNEAMKVYEGAKKAGELDEVLQKMSQFINYSF